MIHTTLARPGGPTRTPWLLALGALLAMTAAFRALEGGDLGEVGLWSAITTFLAWHGMDRLAGLPVGAGQRAARLAVPLLFGLWLLFCWEMAVRVFDVPKVLLPAPSAVALALATHAPTLWADFVQTVLRGALAGYVLGSLLGALLALACDRVPFLARGLLPIASLAGAVPIIGIAPIMVMWFGFDWPSKAAVVVVMTLFPMLVNTLAGLRAAEPEQLDLMRSYAAGWGRTLVLLRLPAALPFLFNGLKINATLALIGAIVAEFFGTPIVGMGFRISTEVSRMNTDIVWASIAVAAVAGSGFYGLLALLEKRLTHWHPSAGGR
ncbi:ABC transporter permease [Rhodospirillum rubrum]|uniref:Binding-protein-dependent transport systems inner membrane component n=1 Tax=Rhodospirillum rubrum (strain ATCC 11170 / ATH 1.1.1 / DSM 467 / LMG 4362 / NCIMB 8255 / S1) TaxID=269796 RepID=Q2RNP6_RHORT|nr:ABC transporter permease [Rhodospirillum rubrum]ABC24249.1 Binding-protein-dependent transport systems inner membrane component [Rhodospirillum rubrum ATCC 11170]AEO50000.1 binding-protein dependent transport system inner membrane protein [Rhodospirillum rubrum F11]MBK5955967.1 ABC transporter permease [Rhodospirillum rubrum]QXG80181.1 ABC transporter permease [Rhodospirillum rubrum]HAQ00017.1 ABC transporter permease [Rhodospirillum rubrum]